MRNRAYRRHKAYSHQRRRLSEDRNQHYDDLTCACWSDPRVMARMREQPKLCSNGWCCGNPRRYWKTKDALPIQERRFLCVPLDVL